MGADDYLTKPFSYVVLLAHLRAVIRRGAPERPVALSAGDLVLDPATRTCRRAATGIELTRREFAVLEYLMRRRDEVVSKTDIMANVWDAFYYERRDRQPIAHTNTAAVMACTAGGTHPCINDSCEMW